MRREARDGKVSEESVGVAVVSGVAILRRGKTDLFRGPWKHPELKTRLDLAFRGGQVYVTGQSESEKRKSVLIRIAGGRRAAGCRLRSVTLEVFLCTSGVFQSLDMPFSVLDNSCAGDVLLRAPGVTCGWDWADAELDRIGE
jgi:hypothetical protein